MSKKKARKPDAAERIATEWHADNVFRKELTIRIRRAINAAVRAAKKEKHR